MINERLKQLRTARGLSQNEMADILEVSLSSYQKYEREKNSVTPSLDVLMRIADYYKVSVDYLLGRSTDTPPLSQLASQFNMSDLEREIVDTYLTLPENVRDSLMDFLEKAVAMVQAEKTAGKKVFKIASSTDNHPGAVRTLTPEEEERLKNAPDVTGEDSDL